MGRLKKSITFVQYFPLYGKSTYSCVAYCFGGHGRTWSFLSHEPCAFLPSLPCRIEPSPSQARNNMRKTGRNCLPQREFRMCWMWTESDSIIFFLFFEMKYICFIFTYFYILLSLMRNKYEFTTYNFADSSLPYFGSCFASPLGSPVFQERCCD